MKGRVNLYASDIMRIRNCSERTAYRHLRQLRCLLGKRKGQVVLIKEYCDAENLSYNDILRILEL